MPMVHALNVSLLLGVMLSLPLTIKLSGICLSLTPVNTTTCHLVQWTHVKLVTDPTNVTCVWMDIIWPLMPWEPPMILLLPVLLPSANHAVLDASVVISPTFVYPVSVPICTITPLLIHVWDAMLLLLDVLLVVGTLPVDNSNVLPVTLWDMLPTKSITMPRILTVSLVEEDISIWLLPVKDVECPLRISQGMPIARCVQSPLS